MNIVSTMVGITIMGAAAPSVMQMSLAPVEAQKRANNFSIAESKAVAYAAANDGKTNKQASIPLGCIEKSQGSGAWDVICDEGKGRYLQKVTRSYRLAVQTSSSYNFPKTTPVNIGSHQCPPGDEWGLNYRGFNETHGAQLGACVPQVAWSANRYENSDSSKWQYDIRQYADMKGYETHPDFLED